jgi:hypothetical protein
VKRQTFIVHEAGHWSREQVVANIHRAVDMLPLNQSVEVTLADPPHSPEAKNYWHGVVVATLHRECEAFHGCSPDEVHEFLLLEYFGERRVTVGRRTHVYPNRTTTKDAHGNKVKLTQAEMGALIEWTLAWAAALEPPVWIPEPVKPWR